MHNWLQIILDRLYRFRINGLKFALLSICAGGCSWL